MYNRLLNQTITRYAVTGYEADGRRRTSEGISESARVQLKQKRRLMPNGNVVIVEGTLFLLPSSSMTDDDRFVYENIEYKVYSIYKVPGANGHTHHLEVEFIKAQTA